MYKMVIIAAFMVVSMSVFAEERLGVVDWRKAVFLSKAAKAIDAKMQSDNATLLERARELEGKIETNRQKLEKDKDLLSQKELQTLKETFQRQLGEFDVLRGQLQNIQLATESRFIASQKNRIDKALAEIAQEHKLTAILDRQSVIYANKIKDYTQELTDKLNQDQ